MKILVTGANVFFSRSLVENLKNICDGKDRTYPELKTDEIYDILARLGLERGKYILFFSRREENIDIEKNSGINTKGLLQAVDTAVEMVKNGSCGGVVPVPDYTDINVSDKVVKIIQSYVGIVNKMVWRK